MRNLRIPFLTLFVFLLFCTASCRQESTPVRPPNIVIVFLDDSGWADFSPFGSPEYPTPNVRRLADEGCRFNNFYVPQAICSASRSVLMTGCFPGRTKVFGAHAPRQEGLSPEFATMGEVFKARGYATAAFGKWHLGDQEGRRSHDRGFDETCGIMYSNDMWHLHPVNPEYWSQWKLQYWENGEIAINELQAEDQEMLTTWYTEHAVDFINRHKDEPFFLYVPHAMPHVPLFCSSRFKGKSGAGLYGDVMMEIDWSVGEINNALKQNGLEDNTIIIMTSDNGPWKSYGNHSGHTPFGGPYDQAPCPDAKGTSFEGGIRSACIVKYPAEINPGSQSTAAFSTVDLLPTLAGLAGADLPANEIDGENVWDIIAGREDAENPHSYYPFSTGNRFEGVISGDGRWKLHIPHPYRVMTEIGNDGAGGKYIQEKIGLSLFDLENDADEKHNVIGEHREIAEQLLELADAHRERFYPEAGSGTARK